MFKCSKIINIITANYIEIITPEPHIKDHVDDFIGADSESIKFCEYLSKINYNEENGHEVKNFGKLYRYTGAADATNEALPAEIVMIIEKIKQSFRGSEINDALNIDPDSRVEDFSTEFGSVA